jgi:hypothetical protein
MANFSSEKAMACMLKKLKDGPATGEVLVWACKDAGITPHDDRAFGSVIKKLSAGNLIEKIGYGPRHKGHGTSGAIIWTLAE